jgi:hypothetical protein
MKQNYLEGQDISVTVVIRTTESYQFMVIINNGL